MPKKSVQRSIKLIAVILGSALWSAPVHGQHSNQIQLLIPRGTQRVIPAATDKRSINGSWTGFIYENGNWVSKEVSIKNFQISPMLKFSFLVRGIPRLVNSSRVMATATCLPQWCLDQGRSIPINPSTPVLGMFESIPFELQFLPCPNPYGTNPPATIALRVSDKEQKIECKRGTETASLVWVGDIDCDGRPDFLVFTGDDIAGWEYNLHISTRARSNKLVGVAAKYDHVPDM